MTASSLTPLDKDRAKVSKFIDIDQETELHKSETGDPKYFENSEKPEVYCDFCEFTTPSKDNLNTHTSSEQNYKVIEQRDGNTLVEFVGSLDKDRDEIYLCDFCDQRGRRKKMRKTIYSKEYQKHNYTCNQDYKANF